MIIFFSGHPRTGKTLGMTVCGYYDFKNGRTIYANYPLNFPHEYIPHPDKIVSYSWLEMERSEKTFLIQEADKWFDARASYRKENRLLSSFVGQSGKRNIDIYYDSQFPTRIDKALRDATDFKVTCEVVSDEDKNPLMFKQFWEDINHPHKSFYKNYPYFFMQEFYKLYDTLAPTRPVYEDKQK